MWAVMMAAMMLPSAAPMILLFGTIARRRQPTGDSPADAGVFGLGYVAVWAAFSLVAVALQFGLDQAALLSPMMSTTSKAVAGAVLIGAGVYQWTPLKQACLRRCRSPLQFLMTEWREGRRGAFVMGLRHGGYCLGCCWVLMLLLFVGGIMNLAWIAGIAAFVLVEKLAPAGHWMGRAAGAALVLWGVATLAP
jgi:predicted metal-binding membrane protein